MKRLLVATMMGAFIALAWGYVSWDVLSWHKCSEFTDGGEVAASITANAPSAGVYRLSNAGAETGALIGKLTKNPEVVSQTPVIYALVRPEPLIGSWRLSSAVMGAFAIRFVGALILATAIFQIRNKRYIHRAGVGCMLGFFAGLMMALSAWNWLGLPVWHVVVQVLDPMIAWTLAGLAMAALIGPEKQRRIFS